MYEIIITLCIIFLISISYLAGWVIGYNKAHKKYYKFYDMFQNKYTEND